jgi:hypothetical protein
LYETLQDAAQFKRAGKRNDPDADLEMLDWQRIKRAYKTLMTDLVNLPMHVIVTARERDDEERRGGERIKVGVRPDAEKSTPYYFDVIVRLTAKDGKRAAIIEKDRTGSLAASVNDPSFTKLFAKAIKAGAGATGERTLADDNEAAEADALSTFSDGLPATTDGGLIGIVSVEKASDFNIRQSASGGWALPFRVKQGRAGVLVVAHDELAQALYAIKETVMEQRVTVWGQFKTEPIEGKGQYEILHLTRIQTPDGLLPAPEFVGPEPPDDVPLEAESEPLGLVS